MLLEVALVILRIENSEVFFVVIYQRDSSIETMALNPQVVVGMSRDFVTVVHNYFYSFDATNVN